MCVAHSHSRHDDDATEAPDQAMAQSDDDDLSGRATREEYDVKRVALAAAISPAGAIDGLRRPDIPCISQALGFMKIAGAGLAAQMSTSES
jgi:hypothetical protein